MNNSKIERDAYIAASGIFLSEHLPENWQAMKDGELDEFVENNTWEPFEYWPVDEIWSLISGTASTFISFHKTQSNAPN
jgi:hypothetical protein